MKIKPLHWTKISDALITAPTFGGSFYINKDGDTFFSARFVSVVGPDYDKNLKTGATALRASLPCDQEHVRRVERLLKQYVQEEQVKPLVWMDPAPGKDVGESAHTFGGRFFIKNLDGNWFRTSFYSSVSPKYDQGLYLGAVKRPARSVAEDLHQKRVRKFLETYVEDLK